MCKKNCLGCQFFCVYGDHRYQGRWKVKITEKDRDQIIKDKSFYHLQELQVDYSSYLCCYKGVWDEKEFIRNINEQNDRVQLNKNSEDYRKLKEDLWTTIVLTKRSAKNPRGNSCFYRAFQTGILLPAAEELETREAIQQEAAADRKWIIWGVGATFVTALTALLAVLLQHWLK